LSGVRLLIVITMAIATMHMAWFVFATTYAGRLARSPVWALPVRCSSGSRPCEPSPGDALLESEQGEPPHRLSATC